MSPKVDGPDEPARLIPKYISDADVAKIVSERPLATNLYSPASPAPSAPARQQAAARPIKPLSFLTKTMLWVVLLLIGFTIKVAIFGVTPPESEHDRITRIVCSEYRARGLPTKGVDCP